MPSQAALDIVWGWKVAKRNSSGIFDWWVEMYHCSFRFDHCFSQGSPNLLLANRRATPLPLRLTWTSNCAYAHRLGQPKNVGAK